MPRVFVTASQIPIITGPDVHYLRDVMRMEVGDKLQLLDGTGKVYEVKISKMQKEQISCEILSSGQEESEPEIKITLAQALPKSQKMDFIVEKCTELGVNKIIPMLTERTIVKSARTERWQKIAKEAAEQCGRGIIPEVTPPVQFAEVLAMRDQFDLALIPWELEKENTLKKNLKAYRPKSLIFMIGPEGGFSEKEIEQSKKAGFTSVSLGKRILRAETAGMAVLSMLLYELE